MNYDQQLARHKAKQLEANLKLLDTEYRRCNWSEQRQRERVRIVTSDAGGGVLLEAGNTELVWGLLEIT